MKDKIYQNTTEKGYVITEYDDGTWACSCPAWKFHKGARVNCKHINQLLLERANTETTINISGIEKQKEVVIQNE